MSKKADDDYKHVYAIIRRDEYLRDVSDFQGIITVTKIMWSEERARHEVERLNNLKVGKDSIYDWQLTRLEKPDDNTCIPISWTLGDSGDLGESVL